MYKATGGVIQQEKSYYYGWQWKYTKERHAIHKINVHLKIHRIKIIQYENDKILRILGVYINPELQWNDQLSIIKGKMRDSIKKVMSIRIQLY